MDQATIFRVFQVANDTAHLRSRDTETLADRRVSQVRHEPGQVDRDPLLLAAPSTRKLFRLQAIFCRHDLPIRAASSTRGRRCVGISPSRGRPFSRWSDARPSPSGPPRSRAFPETVAGPPQRPSHISAHTTYSRSDPTVNLLYVQGPTPMPTRVSLSLCLSEDPSFEIRFWTRVLCPES